MINRADVEKLRSMHAQRSAVLSLYLPVPLDPARLRGLAAEAGDLMGDVSANGPDSVSNAGVSNADRNAVLDALAAHGRDWLGHTVAFFACGELGLFEALPLPCLLPERAVLGLPLRDPGFHEAASCRLEFSASFRRRVSPGSLRTRRR